MFSDVIQSTYQKYILYDILPELAFYENNEYGFEKVKNQKVFIHTLKSRFGHYVRNKNRLYFPKHNLVYYMRTDCNRLNQLRQGDILLKNFVPTSYIKLLKNRKIWVNCDTIHKVKGIEYTQIHLEEYYLDCLCYCEFLENI